MSTGRAERGRERERKRERKRKIVSKGSKKILGKSMIFFTKTELKLI